MKSVIIFIIAISIGIYGFATQSFALVIVALCIIYLLRIKQEKLNKLEEAE